MLGKHLILRGADSKISQGFSIPVSFLCGIPITIGDSRIHVYVPSAFIITFRYYRAITSIKIHSNEGYNTGFIWHTCNPGIPQRNENETGKRCLRCIFRLQRQFIRLLWKFILKRWLGIPIGIKKTWCQAGDWWKRQRCRYSIIKSQLSAGEIGHKWTLAYRFTPNGVLNITR